MISKFMGFLHRLFNHLSYRAAHAERTADMYEYKAKLYLRLFWSKEPKLILVEKIDEIYSLYRCATRVDVILIGLIFNNCLSNPDIHSLIDVNELNLRIVKDDRGDYRALYQLDINDNIIQVEGKKTSKVHKHTMKALEKYFKDKGVVQLVLEDDFVDPIFFYDATLNLSANEIMNQRLNELSEQLNDGNTTADE